MIIVYRRDPHGHWWFSWCEGNYEKKSLPERVRVKVEVQEFKLDSISGDFNGIVQHKHGIGEDIAYNFGCKQV